MALPIKPNIGTKTNFAARPSVPSSKKEDADEFNLLVSAIRANYERLILKWDVDVPINSTLEVGQYILYTDGKVYRIITQYNVGSPLTWVPANAVTILDNHFRGTYPNLATLQAAIPVGSAGDYADVDAGPGTDVIRYIWDNDDAEWLVGAGASVPNATATVFGIAKLYPSTALGSNTDGAPDQNAVKVYVDNKVATTIARVKVTANITGASPSVDLATGDIFELTLTGNVTLFTFTNAVEGKDYLFIFKQDTTAKTLTWATGKYRFPFGTAPALSNPTLNGTSSPARCVDIMTAICNVAGKLDMVYTPDLIEN